MEAQEQKKQRPSQHQPQQPGQQEPMRPQPICDDPTYIGSGKLKNKVAVITGGDSGIGRAIAIIFAKEGADLSIIYKNEHQDAEKTQELVHEIGARCFLVDGDLGKEQFCRRAIEKIQKQYGRIDILVNNAGEHHPLESIEELTEKQLKQTFDTNIFSMFYLVKAALKYMQKGSVIINTASVTAYRGSDEVVDYAATKGAVVAFTRSLATILIEKEIRVNAVAPGPIWTPLIPSSLEAKEVATFGSDSPMHRAGEPVEIAPSYLFLASPQFSSYMTGQVLHPNGGEIVNG